MSALFIPFIMAGHPTLQESIEAVIALCEVGADIIELGVPFSDPVVDGPINQRAAEIALDQGTTLEIVLQIVQIVRLRGYMTPIIIFSYLNPILSMGYQRFATKAKAAGVDGVLVVDLPPEEGCEFYTLMQQIGLGFILLASPTTDPKRFLLYKKLNPLFLYYISRLSVTGLQHSIAPNLKYEIMNLRSIITTIKIAVGFGISTLEQAREIAEFSDGVVVGSLLVQTLEIQGLREFTQLATKLSQAIKMT